MCAVVATHSRAHSIHIRFVRRGKLIFPFSCHFAFPLLEREKRRKKKTVSSLRNWSSYHLHFIGILQILLDISFRSNNMLSRCVCVSVPVKVTIKHNLIREHKSDDEWIHWWGVGLWLLGKNLPNLNLQFRLHIIRKWLCCACEGRREGGVEIRDKISFVWKWNKSKFITFIQLLLPARTYHIVTLFCVYFTCEYIIAGGWWKRIRENSMLKSLSS